MRRGGREGEETEGCWGRGWVGEGQVKERAARGRGAGMLRLGRWGRGDLLQNVARSALQEEVKQEAAQPLQGTGPLNEELLFLSALSNSG